MQAREMGAYFYPGLPNGTEVGQEMDQMFSSFKKHMYANRDKVSAKRQLQEGGDAQITMDDFGNILFGGEVRLLKGDTLNLPNAFALSMEPKSILSARKKCGYCPATRESLKSDRIRH